MNQPPLSNNTSYRSKQWRIHARRFLGLNPHCIYCGADSQVVDHIIPHKKNLYLFWSVSNWQPLCRTCHNSVKRRMDNGKQIGGCDDNGNLINPHPDWNRRSRGGG